MSRKIEKMTDDLIDYSRLVIVAMILIVMVYAVAQSLIGMVPASIGSIIIGLAFAYIYATNKVVRREINSWAKGKK